LSIAEKSYLVGYIIAHEFLHQLLAKAYSNIIYGLGTIQTTKTNVFRDIAGYGAHFDCWLNLNTSGPLVDFPTRFGENPQAELILPSHQMLLNENQSLMGWRHSYGISSTLFKLRALEFSVGLEGYSKYLIDGCEEVTIHNYLQKKCTCGF